MTDEELDSLGGEKRKRASRLAPAELCPKSNESRVADTTAIKRNSRGRQVSVTRS